MRAVFWLMTSTVPRVGASIKRSAAVSVLLPAPDGPVKEHELRRASMLSDTPESASRPGRLMATLRRRSSETDHFGASPISARTNSSASKTSRSATPSPTATEPISTLSCRAIASRMRALAVPLELRDQATPVSFSRS